MPSILLCEDKMQRNDILMIQKENYMKEMSAGRYKNGDI